MLETTVILHKLSKFKDPPIHKCLSAHDVLGSDINPADKAKSQSSSSLHSTGKRQTINREGKY